MQNKDNKIYGLVLEISGSTFLSIQLASSLEQAVAFAKVEFSEVTKKPITVGCKIGLFVIKDSKELISDNERYRKEISNIGIRREGKIPPGLNRAVKRLTKTEDNVVELIEIKQKEPKKKKEKNKIMERIIKTKDIGLLEKHRKSLTKNDIKYIESILLDK